MDLFSKIGKIFENIKNSKINKTENKTDFTINPTNENLVKDSDLEHITSFLNETHQKQSKELKNIANMKYNEIQKNAQLFENSLKKLNKPNFRMNFGSTLTRSDKAHLNLLKSHRKNFTEKSQNLLKQLKKSISDIPSIVDYQERINSLLIEFNKKSMRDFLFFRNLLKQESDEILEVFKKLSSKITEFSTSVWEQRNQITQIEQAQELLSTIELEKEKLDNSKKEILRIKKELIDKKNVQENLKKQLKLLKEDSEYLKNLELHKKVYRDLLNTKNKIRAQAASIEHPLKKFIYASQKSGKISKDKALLINKFLEKPLAVLVEKNNIASLNLIFKKFKTDVLENKIELKNKEKINKRLDEILNQNIFEKLILEYSVINSKLAELEKLKILLHEEKQKIIEKELEQVKSNIETELQDLEQLKKTSSEKEEFVETKLLELKNVLTSLNFN